VILNTNAPLSERYTQLLNINYFVEVLIIIHVLVSDFPQQMPINPHRVSLSCFNRLYLGVTYTKLKPNNLVVDNYMNAVTSIYHAYENRFPLMR